MLFKNNLVETINKIYLERKKTYSEASFRIRCNLLKPEDIVNKIILFYEKHEIKFKDHNSNYSIIIGNNVLNLLPGKIKLLCPKSKK